MHYKIVSGSALPTSKVSGDIQGQGHFWKDQMFAGQQVSRPLPSRAIFDV